MSCCRRCWRSLNRSCLLVDCCPLILGVRRIGHLQISYGVLSTANLRCVSGLSLHPFVVELVRVFLSSICVVWACETKLRSAMVFRLDRDDFGSCFDLGHSEAIAPLIR